MPDGPRGAQTAVTESSSQGRRRSSSFAVGTALSWVVLIASAGAIAARVAGGPAYDWYLVIAAGATAIVLVAQVPSRKGSVSEPPTEADDSLRRIFDSAGPMVISIGLDGFITHLNPAAERLLGYHAAELVGQPKTADIL